MACNVDEKWQSNKAFPTTNMRMLDDEILCDVTFLVGSKKQPMKAHKFILASRSPVFHAMFCGPLAESGDAIQIPDIEEDAFRHLLWYLYTGKCPVTADLVMSLLYAANKYEVCGLTSECQKYLNTNMTPTNVCTILQQASIFDDHKLIKTCTEFININGKTSILSEAFVSLSRPLLKLIVQSDALSANEEDVYSACVKWAIEQCKQLGENPTDANCRAILGDVVELIRFPLMSLETFTSLVSTQSILTREDKLCLFQHFGSRSQHVGSGNQYFGSEYQPCGGVYQSGRGCGRGNQHFGSEYQPYRGVYQSGHFGRVSHHIVGGNQRVPSGVLRSDNHAGPRMSCAPKTRVGPYSCQERVNRKVRY